MGEMAARNFRLCGPIRPAATRPQMPRPAERPPLTGLSWRAQLQVRPERETCAKSLDGHHSDHPCRRLRNPALAALPRGDAETVSQPCVGEFATGGYGSAALR